MATQSIETFFPQQLRERLAGPQAARALGYVGIDPGLSGAIARWVPSADDLLVFDMPTNSVRRGKSRRRRIDEEALQRIFLRFEQEDAVGVEYQEAHFKGGMISAKQGGYNAGVIIGMLRQKRQKFVIVTPQKWKKYFGLIGRTKDESREMASRQFPRYADQWMRKSDHGRAEAALIALYVAQL